MKIGAIIQARMSSTRLPGKVLRNLPSGSDITVLGQVIRRVKKAKRVGEVIVAVTRQRRDDPLLGVIRKEKVKHFRGSAENVLSRYFHCARKNRLDVIVRISSDCPCVDPKIVDLAIEKHIKEKADYTSNTLKRSYPRGLDVEVFGFDALKKAHKKAGKYYEKEHVTPYIYENRRLFKIAEIKADKKSHAPDIRITLDTEEDYTLLAGVFAFLYRKDKFFGAPEIKKLFKKNPWLKTINKGIKQKKLSEK